MSKDIDQFTGPNFQGGNRSEMDEARTTKQIAGYVKWFDPVKGFGFIVAESGGPDILLHANVLRNFGQGSVVDGSGIEIFVQETQRGMQATEVVSITPPVSETAPPLKDMMAFTDADISSRPIEPARVKWFDKAKGFGFANVFGRSEDVFVHIEVLRRSGLADLQSGEAIGLRITQGERGRMAIAVVGWEASYE